MTYTAEYGGREAVTLLFRLVILMCAMSIPACNQGSRHSIDTPAGSLQLGAKSAKYFNLPFDTEFTEVSRSRTDRNHRDDQLLGATWKV